MIFKCNYKKNIFLFYFLTFLRSADCGENQVYTKCASQCPKTCDNWIHNKSCLLECKPGCTCKADYVLEKETNKCIPKEKCRKRKYFRAV